MIAVQDPYALFEEARQQGPNPFRKDLVIAAEEVWGEVISDLSGINQHIEQKIDQAIAEVRQRYLSKVGIVVKGEKGTGKSHAIRRVWKKIEREGGALFSYISPCANPKIIDAHVRFHLVESFTHQDSHKVTQWQRFAATLISSLKGTDYEEAYEEYIEKCSQPNELKKHIQKTISSSNLVDFFGALAEAILESRSGLDHYFTKAVLLSLLGSALSAQVALSWIKGEDSPDVKRFGLPEYSPEQQQTRNIWVIKQICKLAEVASLPVIIWFDQAESSEPDVETGDSAAEVIAKCIDRIYFDCTNIVLLSCFLSTIWKIVAELRGGIPDRVGQRILEAKPPTAEQMMELVQMRMNWFYECKELNPRNYPRLYPFEEARIREIAKAGAGVRTLLKTCAEAFEAIKLVDSDPEQVALNPKPVELDPKEKQKKQVLETYNELLNKISLPGKEDEKIAAIITCAMKMLPQSGTANVVINQIQTVGSSSNHDLHLITSGYDVTQKKEVTIGVRICETKNAKTFNAVMKRLTDYRKYKITRGCLIRSTSVPQSWRIGQQLKQQLVEQQGGEVVVLQKEHIKPLAALERIYEQSADYGFEKEELVSLVQELDLVTNNPLIQEILSAPVSA
ncbi:hypothetical protein [Leptolyngbya sp. FACHB-541]|uniref:hypothetical protein n=1 Tax=Leptolyngbya sp. FACHB-541 TaxID=2692810 RepID=UPI0018EFCF7A|nr:hypothetical protein [Leptolyngbya sp. FACHB-541]